MLMNRNKVKCITTVKSSEGDYLKCESCNWTSKMELTHQKHAQNNDVFFCFYYEGLMKALSESQSILDYLPDNVNDRSDDEEEDSYKPMNKKTKS